MIEFLFICEIFSKKFNEILLPIYKKIITLPPFTTSWSSSNDYHLFSIAFSFLYTLIIICKETKK